MRPGVWWERVQATQQDLSQSSVFLCGLSADVHWCPESQPPPDLSESVISRPKTSKREKSKSKSKSKRDWPQRIKVIQQKKTVHVKSLLVLSQVIWRIKVISSTTYFDNVLKNHLCVRHNLYEPCVLFFSDMIWLRYNIFSIMFSFGWPQDRNGSLVYLF